MKLKVLSLMILFALSIVLITGCSTSPYSTPSTSSQPPTSSSPAATTPESSATSASNQAVTIANFAFSPQTLTVSRGATVTWTNNDSTTHTVTSDTGVWDSGDLAPGSSFSFTFNQTGTFSYHCKIHTTMTASVIVQ